MATVDKALELAAQGFFVFPLVQNSKLPAIEGWQNKATRDPDRIKSWWIDPVLGFDQDYNIGIFTGRYGDGQALLVVDVDFKGKKNGYDTLIELELGGCDFPQTRSQLTPTGGQHLIYAVPDGVRQGVDVLGNGLDIRSSGGFIVGAGSRLESGIYTADTVGVNDCPEWLIRRCGTAREAKPAKAVDVAGDVDEGRAIQRAIYYLENEAPVSVEGEGGNQTAYRVAARLKDLGADVGLAEGLMMVRWNHRCNPPWPIGELCEIIHNAYRYGKEAPGVAAPEVQFPPVFNGNEQDAASEQGTPLEQINAQFSFIKKGAFILQETTDQKGNVVTEHLDSREFHAWFANRPMVLGKTEKPISQWWMEWKQRRQYEAVVFAPEQDVGPRWYNLWRGFRVEKAADDKHPAVDMFKEHALFNVCGGDKELFNWLMGYFAHMIQRPWEKPLVALVFKGDKGTGKNALVERVGWLLGHHFMVADDDRYLLGNFNSHLESNLLLVLDEASWAGDKRAEGRLKGLITGTYHNIERKGKEPYRVDNLTRVVMIGNEQWVAPASNDERRFAVFNVGTGRKQDRKFFQTMREGMEQGGYAHLLRFFMDFDISAVDVNAAPDTIGLLEQKHAGLEPFDQWWLDCLYDGSILGGDFSGWPEEVDTRRFRQAYSRYMRERNIRSRGLEERGIGHRLAKIAPSIKRKRVRVEGVLGNNYFLPVLATAREDWEKHIGHSITWDVG